MDGHTVYQQTSFTHDGDLCITLTTLDHFVTVGVKTLGDRKTVTVSGQIDGWREGLLTSNNIFQKQLASSFFFGP